MSAGPANPKPTPDSTPVSRERYEALEERCRRLEEAQEALRLSEARFRAQYETHPLPTYMWTIVEDDLVGAGVNRAAMDLTEGGAARIIGLSVSEMLSDNPEALDDVRRCAASKKAHRREYLHRYRTIDLEQWIAVTYTFVPPDRVLAYTEDITERKRVEIELRESEQRYRTLFEQQPHAVLTIDPETGLPIEFNDRAHELLGYTREEFSARSVYDHAAVEDEERSMARIRKTLEAGGDVFETRLRAKDGTIRDVQVSTRAVELEGKVVLHTLFRDVTEEKTAQAALQRSLHEKEVLLKEIHHRVKNNLQVVSSLLYLQAAGSDNEFLTSALAESRDRIQSLALIHETLHQSPDADHVDFSVYVDRMATSLAAAYSKEDVPVVTTTRVDAPPLSIVTAMPVGLIVNELVTNALKHAFVDRPDGRIEVVLEIDEGVEPPTYVLTVSDDGRGLPEDWDPMLSDSLGIRLVRALTDQLNGRLEVERGEGTTFVARFPKPDE